jgi:hypothetical protein
MVSGEIVKIEDKGMFYRALVIAKDRWKAWRVVKVHAKRKYKNKREVKFISSTEANPHIIRNRRKLKSGNRLYIVLFEMRHIR